MKLFSVSFTRRVQLLSTPNIGGDVSGCEASSHSNNARPRFWAVPGNTMTSPNPGRVRRPGVRKRALFLAVFSFAFARSQAIHPSSVPDIEKDPQPPMDTRPIAADKKSNVVFILADNVGYGDLCLYGGGELRGGPTPGIVKKFLESVKKYQNRPAANLTKF